MQFTSHEPIIEGLCIDKAGLFSAPRQSIALLSDGNSGDEKITLGRGVVVVEGQMMAG